MLAEKVKAMFAVDQLVVYGGEGVCRVEKIGPAGIPGADKTKLYYTLSPLYRTGQVITPVDTRVLMRPAMTAADAQVLIAALEKLEIPAVPVGNPRMLKDYYQSVVTTYDGIAVAQLICQLARRSTQAISCGKKPSQMENEMTSCVSQL